jgi:pimeloyl-ACP methyl ester carboxylesterase
MLRRIGDVTIETIAAESAKFAAPMVFVHGLWCSATVWRRFMGYLAHRGWTCYAMNLRGHGDAGGRDQVHRFGFADYLADLQRVLAACDAAPIVVGHDLGGLLALACPAAATRAVVALAPLLPRASNGTTSRVLSSWSARMALLRSRPLPPPRGRLGAAYFAGGVPGGATAESARAARELRDGAFDLPAHMGRPTLVVAGARDRFCPPDALERWARRLDVQCETLAGAGHAIPWGAGWEACVAATHRWLIQTLGEPLLLLREEQEE